MPEARESADTRLRDYLLGEAVDFRQLMSSTLGDLQTTEGTDGMGVVHSESRCLDG